MFVAGIAVYAKVDVEGAFEAGLLEFDVVDEIGDLLFQGHFFSSGIGEYVAHHGGEAQDCAGGLFGFSEGHGIDAIEGIEKEVGVYLGFEIGEFGVEFFFLGSDPAVADLDQEGQEEDDEEDEEVVAKVDQDGELASEEPRPSGLRWWRPLPVSGAIEDWGAGLLFWVIRRWWPGLLSGAIEVGGAIGVGSGAGERELTGVGEGVNEGGLLAAGDEGAGQEGDEAKGEEVKGKEEQVFAEKIESGDEEVVVGIKNAQHEDIGDDVALCGRVGQIGVEVQGFGRKKKG